MRAFLKNPTKDEKCNFDLCLEDMAILTDHNIHQWCLREENAAYMSHFALPHEPFLDSGKVLKLLELLKQYKEKGDRVLVFSQFVMVMDILEEVLSEAGIKFFRIDGSTKIDERQPLIDQFYADESVTAFMLSTKAGGAGINLAAANKVIIFGQKRDVEVVRLVTRGTIEEQIHLLGESKILLDERVAGDQAKAEKMGENKIREALAKDLEKEIEEAREGKGKKQANEPDVKKKSDGEKAQEKKGKR